ncbi:LPD23 domain-containing protein, partial [uncultured Campylobacter sp.]|uniref:LPD23 domain-containing protein n=1 Tax=uncultured Campylobacter sp. TaxID=218934 RepID=UPI003459B0DF
GGDALSDLSSPRTAKRGSEADATIISQKGNLINEKAKNSTLPNGVSGIGDNGKLGKIGIQKDYDSEYLKLNHATYSSKADKENKRLLRRNEKSHLVGSPTPTQLTLGEATEPTADGAKALLDENSKDAGIIQTFIQPGSKSNSELGLPNEIIPKQTQELDKTFKNQKDKNTKTINAGPHIASGLLGGTANGADENGNVSPEEFGRGFIYALFGSKFSASAVKRISPELYNSILGLGKKMPQMAKDNPKLLTKIYGSAKSNSINSFAGEKALNASANKLSKAKAMLEKGEDEVKIWQSTGWYKDKDSAWKFEIDDSPAKIKNQNADKLGDLLGHKELFKAYPELKDINVVKIKDELYNKNLKDWHKESSPLTKNTDGTPKIFYHGTKKSNISEFDQKFDKSKWGFFFATKKEISEPYSKGRYGLKEPNSGIMEVYI